MWFDCALQWKASVGFELVIKEQMTTKTVGALQPVNTTTTFVGYRQNLQV